MPYLFVGLNREFHFFQPARAAHLFVKEWATSLTESVLGCFLTSLDYTEDVMPLRQTEDRKRVQNIHRTLC